MSWRPCFDQEHLQKLAAEIADHPQGAGRGGVFCPQELVTKARADFDYIVKDGKTTGNCCVQAFIESALHQNVRPSWKKMNDNKRCQEARKLACDWAAKNRTLTFWGGISFQEMVELVTRQNFDRWTSRLRLTDAWGDVAFLQALACSVGVDVLLIDAGSGSAKLLGLSLMTGDHDSKSLVPVAMHNHYHYWALVPFESCPMEQVALTLEAGKQCMEWDPDFDIMQPRELAIGGREQELQLCESLMNWQPFELPTQHLIECLQFLGFTYSKLYQKVIIRFMLNLKISRCNYSLLYDSDSDKVIIRAQFIRNSAGARDDTVPIGVMARSRRFAILQLAREDAAEQEHSVVFGYTVYVKNAFHCQDLPAQARYVRAERALNAIATLSLQKVQVKTDDSMSRMLSSKAILRIETFLSTTAIETQH